MRSWRRTLRLWIQRFREGRRARRLLEGIFRSPETLSGTSLRPGHAQRWVYLGHESSEGRILRIHFGILRHPRPYAFSPQSHKVIEYYTYDVDSGKVLRERGVNITRARGRDAD